MKAKRIIALLLSMVFIVSLVSACSTPAEESSTPTSGSESTSTADEPAEDSEEVVDLTWYIRYDDQADTPVVNEALSALTIEKINADVDMINIPAGVFNEKMQVILGGQEECDVVFNGSSFADYWGNAARGAYVPLNDLLANEGKETYDAIPEALWDGVRLNGEIYGVINYQIVGRQAGFSAPQKYLDEFDFDISTVNSFEDAEPLLADIKATYPDVTPVSVNFNDYNSYFGYDEIGALGSIGAVALDDESLTVINQYESQGFVDFVTLMHEWYVAGYIAPDAATITNTNDLAKAGKIGAIFNNIKPGGEEENEVLWGVDLTENAFVNAHVSPTGVSATLSSIPATSKNPNKAMEFINLLNTDKEVYNLVCFGIEGTHYEMVDENRIELVENSGYQPNKAWAMGNQFNAYVYGAQADDVWAETIALNESATVSNLLGFVFDMTPVENQVAQCQAVVDQYRMAIMTGSVNPTEYLPQFISALEDAGSAEVMAEQQAQIDAWVASK